MGIIHVVVSWLMFHVVKGCADSSPSSTTLQKEFKLGLATPCDGSTVLVRKSAAGTCSVLALSARRFLKVNAGRPCTEEIVFSASVGVLSSFPEGRQASVSITHPNATNRILARDSFATISATSDGITFQTLPTTYSG